MSADATTSAEPTAAADVGVKAGAARSARARLGLGTLAAYSLGSMVSDAANFGLTSLLLFYLTVVCGLSGAAAGAALGAALVIDAFIDPLVGSMSDNSRSRHGRRHPFLAASVIPVVIAYGALFSAPAELKGAALFAYALVGLLAVRIGISFYNVPYYALGAELSDDYAERTTIAAARILVSVLTTALSAFLAYGVFMHGADGQARREAYAPFAWTSGLLIFAGGMIACIGTLAARGRMHAVPDAPAPPLSSILREVSEVFRNPSFRKIFMACLVLAVALGVASALTLHANTYFWGLPRQSILMAALATSFGILVGVFGSGLAAGRLEKRTSTRAGMCLIGLCQLLPPLIKVAGLIPGPLVVPTLVAASFLTGAGTSAALIGFQSMMADAADEHELRFGARREGLHFAGLTFAGKASTGIGAMIAGLVLDVIGFPHGGQAASRGLVALPAEVARHLGLLYGPGSAVLTLFAILTLLRYGRTRADHHTVQQALKDRRAGVSGATVVD